MNCRTARFHAVMLLFICEAFFSVLAHGRQLEIHYINVGQGGSTLIKGPNGTTIFYDFGNHPAQRDLIPYLKFNKNFPKNKGFDYAVLSHPDRDHYWGYRGLVDAGYDFRIANYEAESESKKGKFLLRQWAVPASKTTAGAPRPIPVGLRIALGNGAEFIVVAANGYVLGKKDPIPVKDKNDKSIAALITFGKFQFIIDGDLGAGSEACTARRTRQKDVQGYVAEALILEGLVDENHGVDIMHIAHHGSESSTSALYYNALKPNVGVISVGLDNEKYRHPRKAVIENVLLGTQRPACVTAPALSLLLQTEDGRTDSENPKMEVNNDGHSMGDIVITTDGMQGYTIRGTNRVREGSNKEAPSSHWLCMFDEEEDSSSLCQIISAGS